MPESDGLMRVFWPRDLPRSGRAGVVVGWRNSTLDLFVVGVLDDVDVGSLPLPFTFAQEADLVSPSQPAQVQIALKAGTLFRSARHPVNRIYELCGHASMHVLGVSNHEEPGGGQLDPSWVRIIILKGVVAPRVLCAAVTNIQIVLYDRPEPTRMQFVSLNPISLALANKHIYRDQSGGGDDYDASDHKNSSNNHNNSNNNNTHHNTTTTNATTPNTTTNAIAAEAAAEDERQEAHKREEKQRLMAKLRQHIIFRRVPSAKEKALFRIVNQVNWAWELDAFMQKNVSLIGARQRRALSVTELVVESATTMRNYVARQVWTAATRYVVPVLVRTTVLVLVAHRVAAEGLLRVLEWRPPSRHAALKDVSATAQQVEIRLQQFCYWPMQFVMLHRRKNDWASVTVSHSEYIRFYNSLWLVANDVIIGIALGLYVVERADGVAEWLGQLLETWSVHALQISISWLMGWPAGLKINSELGAFLGDLFLWVIDYWASCLDALRPALPLVIWLVGLSSFAGASMPVAIVSDLLSVLTMHVYSFYLASARIYHWQLTILHSLFHLFRGKKHNVLRNRIDASNYDLDQLLVGTILFTLLSFLLPTVAVFYLNFALARMVIISLKAVLDTLLSCLNHFPLFAIMLRLKDPRRLPGEFVFLIPPLFSSFLFLSSFVDQPTNPPTRRRHPI